ncbi:MAG TPA: hypothetical protein VLT84_02865 [Acidobacteriota bacterium]|nr:hypothetical protein [Acidobacteriota bacterium]
MSQRVAWRLSARLVVMLVGLAALLAACAKDPVRVDRNRPPTTYLVAAPAESATASYRIHLYWRGEDTDGFISGFQWSWDDSSVTAFHFTTKTDSIFELGVNDSADIAGGTSETPPGTSRAHTFFIRAVDNLGKPDPNLIRWNRRLYIAQTVKPTIAFTGDYPSGVGIDSLCDGQPFEVCWSGADADGQVIGYKFDVGAFHSPIVRDSCVTFNDPSDPNSIAMSSGVYTLTVQAVDNAYALSDPGASKFIFVVNRDPETWFEDASGGRSEPVGYYIQPFLRGQPIPPVIRQFAQGDTVPYRSTVWWKWNGQDQPCDNPSGIEAFSIALSQGSRNEGDPYTIGFIEEVAPGVPFTTNDPAVLGPAGFTNLILDSLDAGNNMQMLVRARDVSDRVSGFQYSGTFRFNCNFPPKLTGFTVSDSCGGTTRFKVFHWSADDEEDGFPATAELNLDNLETIVVRLQNTGFIPRFAVPESVFRGFAPDNPHFAEIRVQDRGGYWSEDELKVTFDVNYLTPTCP